MDKKGGGRILIFDVAVHPNGTADLEQIAAFEVEGLKYRISGTIALKTVLFTEKLPILAVMLW